MLEFMTRRQSLIDDDEYSATKGKIMQDTMRR